jgi:uncharacterized protein (TIGR03435 family)
MEAFARMLSLPSNAGRILVDKTGLTGKYDFTLFFDIPQPGAAADAANLRSAFSMDSRSNSA